MAVDIAQVKKLKEVTGVGLTDAKKALEAADGDFDKALEEMRIKGLAKADKKADREAGAGIVEAYLHGDQIGVMMVLNCETDFVARTEDFKAVAHDIALHIAAANPSYLTADEIPEEVSAKERELFAAELKNEGKPADMIDKIVEGKVKKWQAEICLMNQSFVKNPDMTIEDVVKDAVARLGENIKIGSFSRLTV